MHSITSRLKTSNQNAGNFSQTIAIAVVGLLLRTDEFHKNETTAIWRLSTDFITMKGRVFEMSYQAFQVKVNALIARAGGGISVRFFNDTDKGRFFANFSDGTVIVGNPSSLKVTVKYGSGHQAMATI